jgi:hypothetical protein
MYHGVVTDEEVDFIKKKAKKQFHNAAIGESKMSGSKQVGIDFPKNVFN